jgi:hypothetical protein
MLHRLWDAIAGGDRHLEIAHEQLPKAFLDPVELLKFERALSTDIGRRNAIQQALQAFRARPSVMPRSVAIRCIGCR